MRRFAQIGYLAVLLAVGGCLSVRASGKSFTPQGLAAPGWTGTPNVPVLHQTRELDCGPVAAAMLLGFWGRPAAPDALRAEAGVPTSHGLTAGTVRDLVKARGLEAYLVEGDVADLERELAAGRPVLVGLAKPFSDKEAIGHYEIVAGVNRTDGRVATIDPAAGWREVPIKEFMAEWDPTKRLTLIVAPAAD